MKNDYELTTPPNPDPINEVKKELKKIIKAFPKRYGYAKRVTERLHDKGIKVSQANYQFFPITGIPNTKMNVFFYGKRNYIDSLTISFSTTKEDDSSTVAKITYQFVNFIFTILKLPKMPHLIYDLNKRNVIDFTVQKYIISSTIHSPQQRNIIIRRRYPKS